MSRWAGRLITKTPVTPGGSSPTASAPGVWTLPEMAYWKKQGLWPDASADAYWGYVSYLMSTSSLSNANNNLFVDSSGAFNPVTRSGNTTQGTVTPYGTLWSNYFDGSSYITMASGTAAGTGDFTIEGWFNVSSYSTGPGLYDARPNSTNGAYPAVFVDSSGYLTYYVNTAVQIQGATLVGINTWNHFALCRSGTSTRLFLNGVQQGSTYSDSNNYQMGASRPIIGGNGYIPNGASQLTGYISNIRVVNGTALYTSNFTPPGSSLTAIGGTVLLTCQGNRFLDASTNNVAVSMTGSARVTPYSPFVLNAPGAVYNQSDISYWSGYFNGSSYLSAPDSSGYALNSTGWSFETFVNFTSLPASGGAASLAAQWYDGDLGWWFYLYNNAGTYQLYFSYSTNGSSQTNISVNLSAAPQLNTWNHIAYLYLSGIGVGIFWNGVQIGTFQSFGGTVFNSSSAMQIGARVGVAGAGYYLNGYLSNMRLVNAPGGSYSWPPTAPITAISGTTLLTLQSAAFTDNSTTNAVFTPVGSPAVTGNNPFQSGYYSNYFDGSGDYLTTPSNAAFAYGTGDFTWEMWVFPTAANWTTTGNYYLMDHGSNGGTLIYYQNVIRYYNPTTGTGSVLYTNGGTIPVNQWTHVAVSRSGGTTSLFVNGVLRTSASDSHNYGTAAVTIANYGSGGIEFQGYISNTRIVKGTAVYTGAFTPSTTPLTAITNTSLLTCQSNRFIDNSANNFTISVAGNTAVQSFDPFYTATMASNGGSMYFDGDGDYLSLPVGVLPVNGSFTVETWFYRTSSANGILVYLRGGTGSYAGLRIGVSGAGVYLLMTTSDGTWVINSGVIGTAPVGTWNHVAVVRNGGTITMYLNGTAIYSSTAIAAASSLMAGSVSEVGRMVYSGQPSDFFPGYMSDVRITPGTVLYTSNFTPPTAPLTPSGNTTLLLNGMNAGTYDAAMQNNLETVGNAQVSRAQAKYGTTSVYFDGNSDSLAYTGGSSIAFGTGDFTIELWAYLTNTGTYSPFLRPDDSGVFPEFGYDFGAGQLKFDARNGAIVAVTTAMPTAQWVHIAACRSGTNLRLFINGSQVGTTTTNSTNFALTTGIVRIGGSSFSATHCVNGYLDDFRITRGYARYTANFTPPTAALPIY